MTTIAESAERMEREAFEAWHRNFYRGGYSRSLAWGSFGYIVDTTQAQFVAWQAARRAPAEAGMTRELAEKIANAVLNHCYGASSVDDGMVRRVTVIVSAAARAAPKD